MVGRGLREESPGITCEKKTIECYSSEHVEKENAAFRESWPWMKEGRSPEDLTKGIPSVDPLKKCSCPFRDKPFRNAHSQVSDRIEWLSTFFFSSTLDKWCSICLARACDCPQGYSKLPLWTNSPCKTVCKCLRMMLHGWMWISLKFIIWQQKSQLSCKS